MIFIVGRSGRRSSAVRRASVLALPILLMAQLLLQLTPVAPATTVSASGHTAAVTVAPGGSGIANLTVAVPARPVKADILIAIDTTGSMGPSITNAKADANAIVTGVQGSVPDSQFAVVDFKDSGDIAPSFEYRVAQSMTATAAPRMPPSTSQ